MASDLAQNWWLVALRGVVGILFGIGAFVWPGATLAALVIVFGAYVFVDGIFAVVAGIGMRRQLNLWWLVVLEGVAGIILGLLTFRSPDTIALILLTLIAAWSIVSGIFEIATALRLRKMIPNEWLLILSGVVSIVFGALLIAQPGAGAISIVWLLGGYALLFGMLTLLFAFRLRAIRDTPTRQATGAV
ncbi:MAG TPA: HdeD family acid-resistance protein [Roseiflexaceae bacterium]|nr:HdeD family acid-resistance protein [Roseiflexaceae bacterium]